MPFRLWIRLLSCLFFLENERTPHEFAQKFSGRLQMGTSVVDIPNAPALAASFHPVCLAQNIDSLWEPFETGSSVGYLFVASGRFISEQTQPAFTGH